MKNFIAILALVFSAFTQAEAAGLDGCYVLFESGWSTDDLYRQQVVCLYGTQWGAGQARLVVFEGDVLQKCMMGSASSVLDRTHIFVRDGVKVITLKEERASRGLKSGVAVITASGIRPSEQLRFNQLDEEDSAGYWEILKSKKQCHLGEWVHPEFAK